MPTKENFYVSSKDNKIRKVTGYKPLENAKYFIEVFCDWNHKETAIEIRDIIDEKGLGDKVFHIKVETK